MVILRHKLIKKLPFIIFIVKNNEISHLLKSYNLINNNRAIEKFIGKIKGINFLILIKNHSE